MTTATGTIIRRTNGISSFDIGVIITWFNQADGPVNEAFGRRHRGGPEPLDGFVEDGEDDQRQKGRREHAAEDDQGERALYFRADAVRDGGGVHADGGHQG